MGGVVRVGAGIVHGGPGMSIDYEAILKRQAQSEQLLRAILDNSQVRGAVDLGVIKLHSDIVEGLVNLQLLIADGGDTPEGPCSHGASFLQEYMRDLEEGDDADADYRDEIERRIKDLNDKEGGSSDYKNLSTSMIPPKRWEDLL